MVIEGVAIALGAAAAKKVIAKLATDIYSLLKEKVGEEAKAWKSERRIATLYKQIAKVRMVKTLWQVDKAVDLNQFYCRSHVLIDKKRLWVKQLADLSSKNSILIEGIAGQGKSIFLRYLCAVELALGNRVPIFLELRRVEQGQSLRAHIYRVFESLHLPINDIIFGALASSGRLVLLLDGFDEVRQDLRQAIITEIEHITATQENLQIIVTSRPNTGLEMSTQFQVVRLDNLKGNEYEVVIQKLAGATKLAETIISQIKQHKGKIEDVLCTPLLVTLLLITYKAYHEIPAQLSDFYDSLFQILLQRHDGAKPGYRRERRCAIDDVQYRRVFEALCCLSKSGRKLEATFKHEDLYNLTNKALENNHITENSEKYIADIVGITCLILKEGEQYRFIHKSVQEYYAACYIHRKPSKVGKKFYDRILEKGLYDSWSQELGFLSEIDRYRHSKYYALPAICKVLGILEDGFVGPRVSATLTDVREQIGPFLLAFGLDEAGNVGISAISISSSSPFTRLFLENLFNGLSSTTEGVQKLRPLINKQYRGVGSAANNRNNTLLLSPYNTTVDALLDQGYLEPELVAIVDKVFAQLFRLGVDIQEFLAQDEEDSILTELGL